MSSAAATHRAGDREGDGALPVPDLAYLRRPWFAPLHSSAHLAQSARLTLGLEEHEDVALADGALHVADDAAVDLVHELDAHLHEQHSAQQRTPHARASASCSEAGEPRARERRPARACERSHRAWTGAALEVDRAAAHAHMMHTRTTPPGAHVCLSVGSCSCVRARDGSSVGLTWVTPPRDPVRPRSFTTRAMREASFEFSTSAGAEASAVATASFLACTRGRGTHTRDDRQRRPSAIGAGRRLPRCALLDRAPLRGLPSPPPLRGRAVDAPCWFRRGGGRSVPVVRRDPRSTHKFAMRVNDWSANEHEQTPTTRRTTIQNVQNIQLHAQLSYTRQYTVLAAPKDEFESRLHFSHRS
jgi:hypothetical protein